jgi:hypothetical protein
MEDRQSTGKFIVITSIFPPTEAVHAFAANNEYQLVVAGDKKTPSDWNCKNVKYLSVSDQQLIGSHLTELLPFNHYCRKMMGYLYAFKSGCSLIIDTDDDNIPKANWHFPPLEGEFSFVPGGKGFINVYQLYTDQKIWPRGLPLQLISKQFNLDQELTTSKAKVGIWQGLADEDPDVDAIYRLTSDTPCYFRERPPVVLGKGTISPFNSQNTLIREELFPLLYLPTYVTFRFTDILRGLVAQPLMWLYDYLLGFTDATVVQKRNPHDYVKDFISEIPMYQYGEQVVDITIGAISVSRSLEDNLFNTYLALEKKNIVESKELEVLSAWLKDISKLRTSERN